MEAFGSIDPVLAHVACCTADEGASVYDVQSWSKALKRWERSTKSLLLCPQKLLFIFERAEVMREDTRGELLLLFGEEIVQFGILLLGISVSINSLGVAVNKMHNK